MGRETGIQWTDRTFSPWWGCTKVSAECDNCYAEAWDARWGASHWGSGVPRRLIGEASWKSLRKWDREAAAKGRPIKVFVASMSDVFDAEVPSAWRDRLWEEFRQTPNLIKQVLTKRPQNFAKMLPPDWGGGYRNVWLGVSVGVKKSVPRIRLLQATPAATRFVSFEPLLEDLGHLDLRGIDMGIIGGESGAGARIFDFAHARRIAGQLRGVGAAVFIKQAGVTALDSDYHGLVPLRLRDKKKGADMSEWPEDMRVREFPRE